MPNRGLYYLAWPTATTKSPTSHWPASYMNEQEFSQTSSKNTEKLQIKTLIH